MKREVREEEREEGECVLVGDREKGGCLCVCVGGGG